MNDFDEVLIAAMALSRQDQRRLVEVLGGDPQSALKSGREQAYYSRWTTTQRWGQILDPDWQRYVISDLGFVRHMQSPVALESVLRPASEHQYPRAGTKNPVGKHVKLMIHTSVMETFYFGGPIPEGIVIDHIDEDKWNPSLTNLEPVRQSINTERSHWRRRGP